MKKNIASIASLLALLLIVVLTACDQGSNSQSPTVGAQVTATTQIVVKLNPLGTPSNIDDASPATPAPRGPGSCAPTRPDGEGPYYKPNAPERTSVGTGHVLKGLVKSTKDCSPIPGARIEFWQVGPDAQYDDDHRATMHLEASGAYSFESNFPPGYEGRPPHIHVKVSAQGYQTLTTQYYPADGETEGTFDLVLIPDAR
ncbi:MAG TPA: hypothetical protein VJ183_08800 [Chloroflexia bacterium]|nr:hypothetical protein [Chloroflexia bacterium]